MAGDLCCSLKLDEYCLYRALDSFSVLSLYLTCFFVMIYLKVAYDMTPIGGLFHCCGHGVPFLHWRDLFLCFVLGLLADVGGDDFGAWGLNQEIFLRLLLGFHLRRTLYYFLGESNMLGRCHWLFCFSCWCCLVARGVQYI